VTVLESEEFIQGQARGKWAIRNEELGGNDVHPQAVSKQEEKGGKGWE
jgi:hypothetical protein